MKHECRPTSNQQGFTLIEVSIALLIFVAIFLVLQKVETQSLSGIHHIRLKTFAGWIAENKMAELRLKDSFPAARESKEELSFANFDWKLVQKVSTTSDKNLNRVELDVFVVNSDQNTTENKVLTYFGFIGRH